MLLSGCDRRSRPTEAEQAVANRAGQPALALGTDLMVWKQAFGDPQTVTQKDGGNTFFFWPEHGIAVFCHPLFRSQFKYVPQDRWTVTSILLPLQTNISPHIPPVDPAVRINFSRLLFRAEELTGVGWTNHPCVRIYDGRGVAEAIELQKPDGLVGDYD